MVPRKEETDNVNFETEETGPIRTFEEIQKPIKHKQNGSIHMELGEYRAAKLPLSTIGISFICYPLIWQYDPDPRMDNLPLMSSIVPIIFVCILYVCFSVVWGPRLMANRPAIKLNNVKIIYNLIQVIISTYTFIQLGRLGWFGDYNYNCQPMDRSAEGKPLAYTRVVYIFFLSKILDLVDTIFFVLNKKWSHISLLHVFHHGALVLGIYLGTRYSPGGHASFLAFVNSFVHALMYTYYLLSTMGPAVRPYLWWKKYLTMIQLIQFVIIFFHALQVFVTDCQIDKMFQAFCCFYACVFFYLFVDFYRSAYRLRSEKPSKVSTSNGTKSNGIKVAGTSNGKQGWKSE